MKLLWLLFGIQQMVLIDGRVLWIRPALEQFKKDLDSDFVIRNIQQ